MYSAVCFDLSFKSRQLFVLDLSFTTKARPDRPDRGCSRQQPQQPSRRPTMAGNSNRLISAAVVAVVVASSYAVDRDLLWLLPAPFSFFAACFETRLLLAVRGCWSVGLVVVSVHRQCTRFAGKMFPADGSGWTSRRSGVSSVRIHPGCCFHLASPPGIHYCFHRFHLQMDCWKPPRLQAPLG